MPLLSPKCYELRFITFQSIQRLLSDGYPNEKEALHFVIKQSLKYHVLTGFDTDIDLAYNQYRQFKHKYAISKITQNNT